MPYILLKLVNKELQTLHGYTGHVDDIDVALIRGAYKIKSIESSWTDIVKKLMPLKLNKFEIVENQIHYRDFHSKPTFDIFTKQVHILVENLNNAEKNRELLPSTITAPADVYGGKATASMKMDALANHSYSMGKLNWKV